MEGTTETRENLVKDVGQLKDDVTKIAADAKAHATAHVDEAKKRVNDAIATLQHELFSHPFAILGAGLALGFIFGRRSRRRRD
jgi:hypothetical protein